jgi:hypothetical protein
MSMRSTNSAAKRMKDVALIDDAPVRVQEVERDRGASLLP